MKKTNIAKIPRKPLAERVLDLAKTLEKDEGLTPKEVSVIFDCNHRSVNEVANRMGCALLLYPVGATAGQLYIVNPDHHAKDISKQSK